MLPKNVNERLASYLRQALREVSGLKLKFKRSKRSIARERK